MAKGILQSNSAVMLGKFATVDAPAPQAGAMYFDTTDNKFKFCEDGVNWVDAATGAGAVWGNITGTLSDQTDLQNALDLKIEKPASPTSGQILSYDGANWIAEDAPEAPVTSVNGQTGDVVLDSDNVSEGASNLYFTDARAKAASVVDSLAGSETDQAPSVAAVKTAIANIDALPDQSGHNGQFLKTDGTDADWSALAISDVTNLQDALDDKIDLSEKGAANGVATLDAGGKVPAEQLPSAVMEYKGTWDASTNDPALADGVGDAGDVYVVSVAGSQDLGSGTITFDVGDWVLYNGSIWQKSSSSNAVVSVNGLTGAVSLDAEDIPYDNTVSGLAATEVQAAIDETVALIGSSGANKTLSNLETPTAINQNLLPSSNNSRTIGSPSNRFNAMYASLIEGSFGIRNAVFTEVGQLDTVSTIPSGLPSAVRLRTSQTSGGIPNNSSLSVVTGNTSSTTSSAAIRLETGNVVDGTSGSIFLRPGVPTGSGTRGVIDVTNTLISNVANPVSDQDAATKIYVDSKTPEKVTESLLASQTDTVLLSYDATEYEGCEILYKLKDNVTNEVKMSRLFIANTETSAVINDLGISTDDIDVSFSVRIDNGNVEVLYTSGSNACNMKCQITKIQA